MAISQWSTTASANSTAATGINWAENQAPSTVNNSARGMMEDVADWYRNDAEWINRDETPVYVSATQFSITGTDVTGIYNEDRRVRVVGPTTGTIYGLITGSTFGSNTVVTVTWDSTGSQLQNETLTSASPALFSASSDAYSIGIGAVVQPFDQNLTELSTLATTKGDIAVYNGTGYERLAVGSSNQVLTVKSTASVGVAWAAAAASSQDVVKISTATASNDSTITITGLSTYTTIYVEYSGVAPGQDNVDFIARVGNGSVSTAANYTHSAQDVNSGGTASGDGATNDNKFVLNRAELGNATGEGTSGTLIIPNPGSTSTYPEIYGIANVRGVNPGNGNLRVDYGGYFSTVQAIDRIQFSMSSSNILTGDFVVRGII